ncbi:MULTISPECIES: V-type ATP synthase subunit K [Candidatus Cryosericum]|jgi:V/A-type H+-transporting ATPase subunit K|uniref:V-type ATP synthase subunit K n=3 Tax=Candidatus Cryosericum TaxID=2498709 RepID=A0A398DIN7_9BACT|nr:MULTISPECIES: V-type ATP synthase subunit K [Cryosericum]RIE09455.1 V-type ATP synthase subunit K [Candidatus Cryosericum hinesii]RIE10984.1 V-type ATP synthase subunit K [Candidatus Cryosericum odellii]RIE15140.1 V-type ATP synthase subunit K [Candidatus Cryosericum hinesii]
MGMEGLWGVLVGALVTTLSAVGAVFAFKLSNTPMTSLGSLWTFMGAVMVITLGGLGSAHGIRVSGSQAAGVLSEKPELFGKMFVMMALPGTQGFYSFVCGIMMIVLSGVLNKGAAVSNAKGLAFLAVGVGVGLVEWWSAILQGQASAAAESLTGRQPSSSGQAILIPALVETYAVIALVSGILLILWISQAVF